MLDAGTRCLAGRIGAERVFPIGRQPVNLNAHFYYSAITPETEDGTRIGPEWTLRLVFQLLFPKD